MKWILIVVAVIVALGLVLFIVGTLQPKTHEASVTFRVGAPDSAVWAAVSDLEQAPQWVPDVRKVERLPDNAGRPAYREDWGGWAVNTVIAASETNRKLVKEILPGGAFYGSWTWELAPDTGATRLTITERGTVDNPMFRAMMMFSDKKKTMRGYAQALGRRLGASVTELN